MEPIDNHGNHSMTTSKEEGACIDDQPAPASSHQSVGITPTVQSTLQSQDPQQHVAAPPQQLKTDPVLSVSSCEQPASVGQPTEKIAATVAENDTANATAQPNPDLSGERVMTEADLLSTSETLPPEEESPPTGQKTRSLYHQHGIGSFTGGPVRSATSSPITLAYPAAGEMLCTCMVVLSVCVIYLKRKEKSEKKMTMAFNIAVRRIAFANFPVLAGMHVLTFCVCCCCRFFFSQT